MESHAQIKPEFVAQDPQDEIKSVGLPLEILFYLLRIIAEQNLFKDLLRLRALATPFRDEIDYRIIPEMIKQASSAKMIDMLYQVPTPLGVEFTKIFRDTDQYGKLKKEANQRKITLVTTIQDILDFGCLALCIPRIYDLDYGIIGFLSTEALAKIDELNKEILKCHDSRKLHILLLVQEVEKHVDRASFNKYMIFEIIQQMVSVEQWTPSVEYIESLINQPQIFKYTMKILIENEHQLAEGIYKTFCVNKDLIDSFLNYDVEIKKLDAERKRLEYIASIFKMLRCLVAYDYFSQYALPDAVFHSEIRSYNRFRLDYHLNGHYINLSGLRMRDLFDFCDKPIWVNYANLSYANASGLDLTLFKLQKSVLEYADLSFTVWQHDQVENSLSETIIKNCQLKLSSLPFKEIRLITIQDFETPKALAKCLNEFSLMDKMTDPMGFRKSVREQIIMYAMGFAATDIDLAIKLVQLAEQHEFFLFSSKKIKNTALKLFDLDKHKVPRLFVSQDRRKLRTVLKILQKRKIAQEHQVAKHGA